MSWPRCVRWEPSPSPKGAQPPNFRPVYVVCCGQTAGWINMPLGRERDLGPGDIVLDGDPAPPQRGTALQFSVHVNSGKIWVDGSRCHLVRRGTEVGLGPDDIVLDWDLAPHNEGHSTPHFSAHVYCGQTARWIQMSLGTEVDLGPGQTVLDGDSAHPRKGAQQPPSFRPMSIVAKRSPISATAEHL